MAPLKEDLTALAAKEDEIAQVNAEAQIIKAKIQQIKNTMKKEESSIKEKKADFDDTKSRMEASKTTLLTRTLSVKKGELMERQWELHNSRKELAEHQKQLGGIQQQLAGLQRQAGNLASLICEKLERKPPASLFRVVEPDDTVFFAALHSGKADRKGTVLDLGAGVSFPLDVAQKRSKLFVRTCFVGLFEDVCNSEIRLNIISGTPGVGKSFFMYYCFYKLVQLQKKGGDSAPSRILWEHWRAPGSMWLLDEDGQVYKGDRKAFETELQDKSAWYFADEVPPILAAARTVLFAHPKNEMYEALEKEGANIWYIPLWTEKELLSCREAIYPSLDPQRVRRLTHHYGGVVRYVLGLPSLKDERFDLDELEHALRTCNVAQVRIGFGGMSCGQGANHRILHMEVDRKTFKPRGLKFASEYVEDRFVNQALTVEQQSLLTLMQGSKGQLQGHLFEAYMHRKFELGGKFECVALGSADLERGANTVMKEFRSCLSEFFNDIEDIKLPQSDSTNWVYWRPISLTFPTITSLVTSPQSDTGCRLLHMTTNLTQEVSRLELEKLVNKLLESRLIDEDESCDMYFVVPDDVFQRFKLKTDGDWSPVEHLKIFVLCGR